MVSIKEESTFFDRDKYSGITYMYLFARCKVKNNIDDCVKECMFRINIDDILEKYLK